MQPSVAQEKEMVETACRFTLSQGLTALALGRKTFMTDEPPPLRSNKSPTLYVPSKEYGDEEYREALLQEPGLFGATFSCRESYNAVACGKCRKCREKEALYSRIRTQ